VYARRPEVERQLLEIAGNGFALDPLALNNRDRNSDGYIYDETLVYLFRRARNDGDDDLLNGLYAEIDRRALLLIGRFRRELFSDDPAGFEDFRQDIAMAILRKILDTDSDDADYAQVNFGDYLLRVAHDTRKAVFRRLRQRPQQFGDMRPWEDEAGEPFEDTLRDARPHVDDVLAARAAIASLPPNIRLAAAMYFLDGWQIKSNLPSVGTISGYFGVTGRTVRNWLRQARDVLMEQGWRG
jgi:DNA-directed RNA polymerase specialized sigma24 family protein